MFRAQIASVMAASAIVIAGVPASGQTAAGSKVISDQILPQETFLYVSCPNVSVVKQQFGDSSMGKLWNDPALDDFKAEVMSAFESELDEGLVQFQEALGLTLGEFLEIPSGEVSMAISGGPGNTLGALVFLDFGDNEARVQDLLQRARAALGQAQRLSEEEESFDDTELTMFRIQYPQGPPTPLAKEFGWFVKDQRLVISNRLELLQSVLTNWDGTGKSFMDNEAYAYILGKCQSGDRTAMSTFFFDPVGLFTKLVQTGSLGQEASMGAGMALGFLPTLGITQLKAMGGVTEAGTGDFEAVSRSVFYTDQPPMGLMRVMQLDQIEQTPPDWVKQDVHAYAAVKWKIQDAFEAIESLVDMFSGAGAFADRLDQLADRPPGIHPKHDIVDLLTGEIRLVTAAGSGGGYAGDQMLVALGVRDEQAASDLLTKIAEPAGMETRDFRGATIYEFNGPAPGQSIGVTVSENRLIICIGGALLEQVLRNDSDVKPLSQSDEYRKVAQHFPPTALSVQFSRPAEQYRSIYEMLRSGEAAEQFPGNPEIFETIDFTTLPPFDVIAKYIQPTGGYTLKDDNGVFMEAFQLK
ncbi:MAG: hypothetical protein RIK87_08030 [Fuerstiella sp.]